MTLRHLAFSTLLLLASFAPTRELMAHDFVALESISFDEVCGVNRNGETACLKGRAEPTWIPDTVQHLERGFSNDFATCGLDATGLKCWRLLGGTDRIDGLTSSHAFKKLLSESDPARVRTSKSTACGMNPGSKELHCLVPYWTRVRSRSLHLAPKNVITAFDTSEELVCWADTKGSLSTVNCVDESSSATWPKTMALKDLKEMTVGENWVCARSDIEGLCWTRSSTTKISTELVEARQWRTNHNTLCLLTKDHRFACADPKTGVTLAAGLGNSVPDEFAKPNPETAEIWTSDMFGCTRSVTGNVSCWHWWNGQLIDSPFSRPVDKLFGSSYQPCARLDNGQAECRLTTFDSQSLRDIDRVRVEFGGYNKCFWNSSGVDCGGRLDGIDFKSVVDVSTARDGDAMCVIGVPTDAVGNFNTVQCFSYDPAMKAPPFELTNPSLVATSNDKACAISEEGVTCWGTPYPDTPMPMNFANPRKLEMGSRHACVLDDFGFACWGELASLGLEIPLGLDQPGRVIDFALGSSRTCVILDSGIVECWGRDYELSGAPPKTTRATSILGRAGLFCALDETGVHCWGGETGLPK